ncbi:MAG: polysaccharide biosynthesis/export family protein [Pirellulales bacterium]
MNAWLVWLANPLPDLEDWPRIVFVVAWQSTAIAVMALAVTRCVRRPALRAWILLLGIVAALLAPVATSAVRAVGCGLLPAETVAARDLHQTWTELPRVAEDRERGDLPSRLTAVDDLAAPSAGRQVESLQRDVIWFGAAWLVATSLLAIRLIASCWRLRAIVRRAAACDDLRVLAAVERIASRLGVARLGVLLSDDVACPTLCGVRRPSVLVNRRDEQLFPPGGEFASAAWEAMLRHELAHVRRRDGASRLAVEAMLALLPWQPLLWWMRRRFYAAAEEACDDWTVFDGTSAVDLAELLTQYVSSFSTNPIGIAMNASDTKRRILRLLSSHSAGAPTTAARWRGLLAAAAAVFVAAVAAAQKPADESAANSDRRDAASGEHDTAAAGTPFGKDRPYIIEPPDILTVKVAKLVPKAPQRIDKLDTLRIAVDGTLEGMPIFGSFKVDASGAVDLGFAYGKVSISGLTEAKATKAVDSHLRTMLVNPRVILSIEEKGEKIYIEGEHLVGPDGSVNLGVFGAVYVNGLTLAEAQKAIEAKLSSRFDEVSLAVDVYAYNSKVYYVIEDNSEGGDRVRRVAITGNETVLDALANVESLRIRKGTRIWIGRAGKGGDDEKLTVDWDAIARGVDTKTNYTLWPGDRVFISQPGED